MAWDIGKLCLVNVHFRVKSGHRRALAFEADGRSKLPAVELARSPQIFVGRARGTATANQLAVSSLAGFRTPAPGVRGAAVMGPASENLHTSGSGRSYSITSLARVSRAGGIDADRLRGLEIDHRLEVSGLLHRYYRALRP